MIARRTFLLLAFALAASACTGRDAPPTPSPDPSSAFGAELASTDLVSGTPQDLQVGLLHSDPSAGVQPVVFGQVTIQLAYLGDDAGSSPQPGAQTTAEYLPAPETPQDGEGPALAEPGARGVYLAHDVTFDHPGLWSASVSADVRSVGTITTSVTSFLVAKTHVLPAPGDRVVGKIDVDNHVIGEKGVPPAAIDSRALGGAPIPDPDLHRWTVKQAVGQRRPILLVLATPTYCLSQFCGPTTDAVSALEERYADRAVFIHIEIYRSFDPQAQQGVINQAAADWLLRRGDLTEPWLYLIGADGIIQHRWGPLFDVNEVAEDLAALPPMTS